MLISCNRSNDAFEFRIAQLERKVDSLLVNPTLSAVDEYQLRSKCAECGNQIMNDNVIGSALTQSQMSTYNPKMRRCYVELTVQSADLSANYFATYLYDGQTKSMLAFATIKNGRKSGTVLGRPIYGFDKTNEYITDMMRDN
jgi:hypothetical protein